MLSLDDGIRHESLDKALNESDLMRGRKGQYKVSTIVLEAERDRWMTIEHELKAEINAL